LERARSTNCSAGRVSTTIGVATTVATDVEVVGGGVGVGVGSGGLISVAVGLVQPARSAQDTSMAAAKRAIGNFMQESLTCPGISGLCSYRWWVEVSGGDYVCFSPTAGSVRQMDKKCTKEQLN
jgi:hypothetical protein